MTKIYKIINNKNDLIYIGQTDTSLEVRINHHQYQFNNAKRMTKFYNALETIGFDNFDIILLEEVEEKDATIREHYWIKLLDTVNNGYNSIYPKFKNGGDTLTNHPDLKAIGEKISEKVKYGDNPQSTKIKVIDIENGEEKIYDSMSRCQSEMDIPRHDIISRRCRKIIKSPYNGRYLFEYV